MILLGLTLFLSIFTGSQDDPPQDLQVARLDRYAGDLSIPTVLKAPFEQLLDDRLQVFLHISLRGRCRWLGSNSAT